MSKGNHPQQKPGAEFFCRPLIPAQRQYEALRAYLFEGLSATEAAEKFGYTPATLYSLCRDLRRGRLTFFLSQKPGPKGAPKRDAARERVLQLRRQNYSVYDIQKVLASEGLPLSHTVIPQILREEGFARLPRRRNGHHPLVIQPESSVTADVRALEWKALGSFETQAGGLFVFVPTLVAWAFDTWIQRARLPGSQLSPALNSMLAMVALKLTGREGLSHVMDMGNDAGFSLFAAINVLPKTTALSTYSYRVTREMTVSLLKNYHQALQQEGNLP